MKKLLSLVLVITLLLLSACSAAPAAEDGNISILCTTYPVYLFTTAVAKGVEGVDVSCMIDQSISCVHDYSLSVTDMKKLDEADVVVINGAGFEVFLSDIDLSQKTVIDATANMTLLPGTESEFDPHVWLDPQRAGEMAKIIAAKLLTIDGGKFASCAENAEAYSAHLDTLKTTLAEPLSTLECRQLITFHDGFAYFAEAFGLDILKAVEEEAGSEASAADVAEIVGLIGEYDIPAIFTELNGSTATAEAISRETGVKVATLNMIISSDGLDGQADPYEAAITNNVMAVYNAMFQAQ